MKLFLSSCIYYKRTTLWHGASIAACIDVTWIFNAPSLTNSLNWRLGYSLRFLSCETMTCVPSLLATAHGLNLRLFIYIV